MVAYVVEGIDDIALLCEMPLKSMDWMSPFVWRETGDSSLMRMMMRGVQSPLASDDPTGFIWCGTSRDGLVFDMDVEPAITPGPDQVDLGGVEDPTVWTDGDQLQVCYTGVEEGRRQGSLLMARGPNCRSLVKRAVMLQAPPGQGNIKESSFARSADGSWRLFYEFASDGASRIGMATAPEFGEQWSPVADPFSVRADNWDNWHLSTGPIIHLPGFDPVMFYNGATVDARWRIGWISFDPAFTRVTSRCVEPMLVPPPAEDRAAVDIVFAASALVEDQRTIHLYYSVSDRQLARATIGAYGRPDEQLSR
jgi:predicted GH43/DUF377 family glycosyl hydrolase